MENSAVIRAAWAELEPLLASSGYELVEVEVGGLGSSTVLRLFIDKAEGGVGVDDCTNVSRIVNPVLDAVEWFPGAFMLEVSSPGIDRPVRKAADFARFAGEKIRLTTVAPVEGKKKFKGTLEGIEEGVVRVRCEDGPAAIHIENVKRANLEREL